ncbi:hypothetical protein HYQ44_014102 [Verticillium longisporum]|nr:hypothetical protein HYQ44_014102 [Verticillium longisporum]
MEGFASTVPQSSMPALSWDDLRVTITELYLDQGLTLPRLMERMRLEYGLHASTKMHASRMLLAYINLIHKTLGAAFPIVQDMLSDAMDRLLCYDLVSPTEVVTMGQCMVLAAEAQGHTQCKDHANLKKALAAAYVKLGDLRSGRLMATEVLAMHDVDLGHKDMLPAVHMLISRIDEAEGLVELARESALRAILASIETFGRWSDWTVNSLIHYRRILERAGRIDDARKVEDDRDLAIRQLQQKLENFNISDEPT